MADFLEDLPRPWEDVRHGHLGVAHVGDGQPAGQESGIVETGMHFHRHRPLFVTEGHDRFAAAGQAGVNLALAGPLPAIDQQLAVDFDLESVLAGAQGSDGVGMAMEAAPQPLGEAWAGPWRRNWPPGTGRRSGILGKPSTACQSAPSGKQALLAAVARGQSG